MSGGWTKGPWTVSLAENPKHGSSWGGYWQIDGEFDAIACNQFCMAGASSESVSIANARLIAEAGTVANETGLTPRQLADQRAELLALVIEFRDFASRMAGHVIIQGLESDIARIEAVIAKATGAA